MKIIEVKQNTPEWHELRKGKITGTKSAACLPTTRKCADGTNIGKDWWEMLAERMTGTDEDGVSMNAMERGHDLENDCAEITVARFGLKNPKHECGIWQSEENENLILSPDCHEDEKKPTWAIECKALNSAEHIKTIYRALEYKLDERPKARFTAEKYVACAPEIDKIPQQYREQALDYFIVNPDLATLYFALYDPRFKNPLLRHFVFVINRAEVEKEIAELKAAEELTLNEFELIQGIIADLMKGGAK